LDLNFQGVLEIRGVIIITSPNAVDWSGVIGTPPNRPNMYGVPTSPHLSVTFQADGRFVHSNKPLDSPEKAGMATPFSIPGLITNQIADDHPRNRDHI
jgi:hypothetical protein